MKGTQGTRFPADQAMEGGARICLEDGSNTEIQTHSTDELMLRKLSAGADSAQALMTAILAAA